MKQKVNKNAITTREIIIKTRRKNEKRKRRVTEHEDSRDSVDAESITKQRGREKIVIKNCKREAR